MQAKAPSDLRIVTVGDDKRLLNRFIRFPEALYANDPAYVAPLRLERKMAYDKKSNPFYQHAEAELFLCYRGKTIVGRISAQIDREHLRIHADETGFFGSFECIDEQAVAHSLFAAAAEWLKERGMKRCRGPFTMNINEDVGLLIDGFEHPPMFLTPHHLPYYRKLIEGEGLQKVKEHYAWRYSATAEVPRVAQRIAERTAKNESVRIRTPDMSKFEDELRSAMEIFNEAWQHNWGFVPLTEAELKKSAADLKLVIDPRLLLIAEMDGKPVGMALTVPNINEAIKPLKGSVFPFGWARLLWRTKVKHPKSCRLILLGIRTEYRNMRTGGGLAVLLCTETRRRAVEAGYEWAEMSQTLEDNEAINNVIRAMGGELYKRYYAYEKAL